MAADYDLFNRKLLDFVNDLILVCPEFVDLRTLKSTILFGVNLDAQSCQQIFNSVVATPYGKNIEEQNEVFFLEHKYENHEDMMRTYGYDFDIVDKIKSIWKELSPENKQAVWDHLRVLLVLSNRIVVARAKNNT